MLVTNCRFYLHNISSIRGLASLEYYPNKTAAAMGAKQLSRRTRDPTLDKFQTKQISILARMTLGWISSTPFGVPFRLPVQF